MDKSMIKIVSLRQVQIDNF